MSKHTPGPWFVTPKNEVGPRSDNDDQSFGMVAPICDVFGTNKIADARLISAAPELLEALKIALESMELVDGENDCRRAIAAAEAAIAKACGEV